MTRDVNFKFVVGNPKFAEITDEVFTFTFCDVGFQEKVVFELWVLAKIFWCSDIVVPTSVSYICTFFMEDYHE